MIALAPAISFPDAETSQYFLAVLTSSSIDYITTHVRVQDTDLTDWYSEAIGEFLKMAHCLKFTTCRDQIIGVFVVVLLQLEGDNDDNHHDYRNASRGQTKQVQNINILSI